MNPTSLLAEHLATKASPDRAHILAARIGCGYVAKTSTSEMYAWVGQSRFDDRDLVNIVRDGTISTGSFAAFLTSIFRTEDAIFTHNGGEFPVSVHDCG